GQSQLLPPELERNDDVWELCLAQVRISAGTNAITQADITDTRLDSDLCGVTENPLGGISDDLFKQYDQEFQDWYSRLKDILDENAAANLQTQIDTVKEDLASVSARLGALEATTYTQIITTSDTNLNDYIQAGKYYFSSSYTPVNIPEGVNGWLTVETTAGSDWVVQYWRRAGSWSGTPTNHETFTRTYTGGSWSDWSIYLTNQTVKLESTNLNNYLIPGIYYFPTETSFTNAPEGVNGTLIVLGGSDSGRIHRKQMWLRTGTPGSNDANIHVRTYSDNLGWGAWHTHKP
ncbi:MAG: pyocin knob domain-containing protein, partial [Clostridiales bacterium]|nr:pyocin knob domain-containing protein [Clostridiales bacterium]